MFTAGVELCFIVQIQKLKTRKIDLDKSNISFMFTAGVELF